MGAAGVADILAQEEGFQAEAGGFQIVHGILAGPGQVADGLVLDLGNVDRVEVTGTQQAGERDGVAAIGLDPIPRPLRDERGGDRMAGQLLAGEIAVQPVAARAGLVGEQQAAGLRFQGADQFIDIALAGADVAEGDDLRAALFRGVGHGDGLLVHIETDIKGGARLFHG